MNEYDKLTIEETNEKFHKKYPQAEKQNYNRYLRTKKWKKKRAKILKRAKYKCEICKVNRAWQVHHTTYKNIYNETVKDLIAVCEICHKDSHNLLTEEEMDREVNNMFSRWYQQLESYK